MNSDKQKTKRFWPVYLLSGLLLALPMLFSAMAPVAWFALAPVYYLEYKRAADGRRGGYLRALGRGLLLFYGYGLVTFYWLTELYPLDFIGLSNAGALAVIAAGWLGLPLLQGVVAACQFVVLRFLLRLCRLREHVWLLAPAAASLWCLFEFLQTLTWAGVPWGKLAMGQAGLLPLVQSASVVGSYGVSFLVVLTGGLLAVLLLRWRTARRCATLAGMLAAVVFLANLGFGLIRIAVLEREPRETVTVAAVQANVSSKEKWGETKSSTLLERYTDLTAEAAERGAAIVVWPESAFPYEIETYPELRELISAMSANSGVTLFATSFSNDTNGDIYNVLYAFEDGKDTGAVYAKRHLVPFGEYVPWRPFFEAIYPPLANLSALGTDVHPGTEATVFETAYGKVGALICFDSIYESLARDSVRGGAELLLVSTNDSWFGESAALRQHERHAALRAVENGRYVIRAANTGISAILTDTGRETASLGALRTGVLVGDIAFRTEETVYTRLGDVILWLSLGFLAAAGVICAVHEKRRKE